MPYKTHYLKTKVNPSNVIIEGKSFTKTDKEIIAEIKILAKMYSSLDKEDIVLPENDDKIIPPFIDKRAVKNNLIDEMMTGACKYILSEKSKNQISLEKDIPIQIIEDREESKRPIEIDIAHDSCGPTIPYSHYNTVNRSSCCLEPLLSGDIAQYKIAKTQKQGREGIVNDTKKTHRPSRLPSRDRKGRFTKKA